MLMLAGGGECCADVEARAEERLFGPVASDSTTWRVFRHELGPEVVAGLQAAIAPVRNQVWPPRL